MGKFDEVVEKLLEWLEVIEDLAAEQIPGILQEILSWGLIQNLVGVIISIGIVVASVKSLRHISRVWDDLSSDGAEAGHIIWAVLAVIFGIIFSITFIVDFFDVLQVYFAPRVYLIKYLRGTGQ